MKCTTVASVLSITIFVAHVVAGDPVMIGNTTFQLGDDAFPYDATYVVGVGVGWPQHLIGHSLDVAYDCGDDDIIQLDYPAPIVNVPGSELWVGQAFGPDPLNRFSHADISANGTGFLRVDGSAFQFTGVVYWIDLNFNGFFEEDERYQLKAATVNLSNLGVPEGEAVTRLWVRGVEIDSFVGLATDYVMVGNLNRKKPADLDDDGDADVADHAVLAACIAGPDVLAPPPGCHAVEFEASDLDSDADADLTDFALFEAGLFDRYSPPATGASIGGRIELENGSPLANATVSTTSVSIDGLFVSDDASDGTGAYTLTDILPGTYTVTPTKSLHLFLPTGIQLTTTGQDLGNVNFIAYALPDEPDGEIKGDIISIDYENRTFTADDDGDITMYTAHIAAVYEGIADSFQELWIGARLEGDYFTDTGIATLIKTSGP